MGTHFGPLVVAGLYVPVQEREAPVHLDVRVSATLANAGAHRWRSVPIEPILRIVLIAAKRYNARHASMGHQAQRRIILGRGSR